MLFAMVNSVFDSFLCACARSKGLLCCLFQAHVDPMVHASLLHGGCYVVAIATPPPNDCLHPVNKTGTISESTVGTHKQIDPLWRFHMNARRTSSQMVHTSENETIQKQSAQSSVEMVSECLCT
eukprot:6256009-Amphidinium_carterae.1